MMDFQKKAHRLPAGVAAAALLCAAGVLVACAVNPGAAAQPAPQPSGPPSLAVEPGPKDGPEAAPRNMPYVPSDESNRVAPDGSVIPYEGEYTSPQALPPVGDYNRPAPSEILPVGEAAPDGEADAQAAAEAALTDEDRAALEALELAWPVEGGYISNGIWSYPGHTGTDIAADEGTDICAAAPGTVVHAKQTEYGYGRQVVVDHGGGVQTLYAHCKDLFVEAGDTVERGDKIAEVGRTGNATGSILHLELRLNGACQDVTEYIGTEAPED